MSPDSQIDSTPPVAEVSQLADHLFRHEGAKLVSILTSIFGIDRLQLAEDVVQEALAKALQTWPYYGVPKNPAAWLTQTAKNLALDQLRREKNFNEKQPQIISFIEQWGGNIEPDSMQFENEIKDGRLRLIFACCHPLLSQESQIALALKTLCGFSPGEIAKAFLTSEAAINKRLTRARQRIQELRIPFQIPEGDDLPARLNTVLQTIYLLFNEGYKASAGDRLIREDLCLEAIRLTELLVSHPIANQPSVHALLALMLLNASRLPARVDSEGNILRLEEQDRALWNKKMIAGGMFHLSQSAAGPEVSAYHLQAAIAATHCISPDFQSTNWPQILSLYDRLIEIDDSPVVALNRAVAIGQVHGPAAGIEALAKVRRKQTLESYHLLYAVLAEFESQLSDFEAAAKNFRTALDLANQDSERKHLQKRLDSLPSPVRL